MRTKYSISIFLSIFLLCEARTLQARSIPDLFIRSTVFIHNKSTNSTGTGFLIKRVVNDKGDWKLVLISNKHVLMPKAVDPAIKDNKAEATFSLNISAESGVSRKDITVVLRTTDGKLLVKPHPNAEVDVAGVELPPDVVNADKQNIDGSMLNPIPEERIMSRSMIKENFLTIGDTSIVLGYPLNLVEAGHVIPIARSAVFATSPREDFRGAPVFLIDSAIVRGSSGSPVIIPMASGKWVEEMKMDTSQMQQSYVVGIVAATVSDWEMVIRKTVMVGAPPEEFTVFDSAKLGIVFRSDCIIDILNELGITKWDDTKNPSK